MIGWRWFAAYGLRGCAGCGRGTKGRRCFVEFSGGIRAFERLFCVVVLLVAVFLAVLLGACRAFSRNQRLGCLKVSEKYFSRTRLPRRRVPAENQEHPIVIYSFPSKTVATSHVRHQTAPYTAAWPPRPRSNARRAPSPLPGLQHARQAARPRPRRHSRLRCSPHHLRHLRQ